jgi:molybdopterin-guanine dinucleotide biosynthesis protein A
MHTDKASLIYDQNTFLQRAISLLSHYTQKIVISSNRQYQNINYPIVKDSIKNIGPIGGIYSVLKHIDTQKVLIIPVDTPLLSKKLIHFLLDNYKEQDQLTILKSKDGLQMLIGIYDKSLIPVLEKQINKKDYKLRNLLDGLRVNVVDASEYRSDFKNINTKKEFDKLIDES